MYVHTHTHTHTHSHTHTHTGLKLKYHVLSLLMSWSVGIGETWVIEGMAGLRSVTQPIPLWPSKCDWVTISLFPWDIYWWHPPPPAYTHTPHVILVRASGPQSARSAVWAVQLVPVWIFFFFWLRCVLSGCHAVRQWCLSFCHWMARASFVCHHGYPAATQKGDATKSAIRWEISLQGYPAPFVHHVHAVDAVLGAMISFLADDSWKIHCKVNYIPSLLAIKLPCHGHLFPNASLHTYRETEGATEKETERSKEKEREKYRKKDREREVQKERKRIKNYTFFSFRSLSSSPYCENNSWE